MVGTLSTVTAIGSGVYPGITSDGALSAVMVPVVPQPVSFTGNGNLGTPNGQAVSGTFAGRGSLSAVVAPIYALAPSLAGAGTLASGFLGLAFPSFDASGTGTFAIVSTLAKPFVYPALASTGALVGTAGMQYLFSPAFAANGALSETHQQLYFYAPALAGGGTVAVTTTQIYSPPMALTGNGSLSASAIISRPVVTGYTVGAASTIPLPTHAVGDMLILMCSRDGYQGQLKVPTAGGTVPAWITSLSVAGDSYSPAVLFMYAIATMTNHTSGTLDSFSLGNMALGVRGQSSSNPVGTTGMLRANVNSTTNAVPTPAITLVNANNSSLVLDIHLSGGAWQSAAPSGYTAIVATDNGGGSRTAIAANTQNVTTSAPGCSMTGGGMANTGSGGVTVEIRAY